MTQPALSEADHARITAAIRAGERLTAGEIYVVVTRAADEYRLVPVLWAALLALLLPWSLHLLSRLGLNAILVAQAAVFVVAAFAFSLDAVRPRLVPQGLRAEAVRRAARSVFLAHGVHLTEARTGVLVFAALAERRVEVLADHGIHGLVQPGTWDGIVAEVTGAGRAGALADGLVRAVERLAEILAVHVPPGARALNELSDRAVEI